MTVCVCMRGDAGQVKQCVSCHSENFEMVKNLFPRCRCHDKLVKCACVTLGVTHFVKFVTYA